MKNTKRSMIAAALCAAVMLAGCSNDNKAQTTTANTAAVQNTDRPAATSEFMLTESDAAGNSGDVKLEKGDTYAVISIKDYGDIKIKLYPDLVPYAVYNFVELAKKGTYNGRNFHRLVEDFMIQGGSANGTGGGGKSIDGGEFKNEVNTSLRHYYGALCYAASAMGGISDGFYIVNNKKPQPEFTSLYDQTSQYYTSGESQLKAYLEELTPDMDYYEDAKAYYSNMIEYYSGCVKAITGMKDTITDDVKKTYSEKGGTPSLDGAYTVFGQTVEGFDVIDKITAVEKTDDGFGNISKPVSDIIIDKVEIFTME